MSGDLADRLAAEARELRSHVPPDEQPDDDAPGEMCIDAEGHFRLRFDGPDGRDGWRLTYEPGDGWATSRTRISTDPLELRVTVWRDGEQIGDATVPGVLPDLN